MKRILNLILLMYFTIFSFGQVEDDVYYRPSKKVKKIVTVENTQDTVEYNYTYTYRIKNFNRHNIEYIYIDNYYIYPYYGRYNNIYGRYNIYSSYYYNFIYPYYHRYNYWETYHPYNNSYWYHGYRYDNYKHNNYKHNNYIIPHKYNDYNKYTEEKKVYTPTSTRTNTTIRSTNINNTSTRSSNNTTVRTNSVYNTQNRSTINTPTRSTNNSVRTNSNTSSKQNNGRR